MRFQKKGKIFEAKNQFDWWVSHTMAPSAILLNNSTIRIFMGCLDKQGISRIGYIDVDANNPSNVLSISKSPVLDIGHDGTFDENGVFPAHATVINNSVYLYYTGFQLGYKIRHYNFGGLAISKDGGNTFVRYANTPVLDRADEGLYVRAGQSVMCENGIYKSCYSAGSSWVEAGNKLRPVYNIFYQESADGVNFQNQGHLILSCDHSVEHGLGRPQLIKHENNYYIFYTRRILNMKYHLGCAKSKDCITWERIDEKIGIEHSKDDFDSEMVYFPSFLQVNNRSYLFYSGNNFGLSGLGYAELEC